MEAGRRGVSGTKGDPLARHGGEGWARKKVAELGGSPPFSAIWHHLLSLLISPGSLYTTPSCPSGLGFLRKEFVLTTRDLECMWVGWPGVMTTAE